MASSRFCDAVGFATSTESAPGVWEDVISEKVYRGNVVRNTRRLQEGVGVNDDITVSNSISIVADPYASKHIFAMRYVKWAGTLWTVTDVEVQSPRLILRLGEVYNGPRAAPVDP